MFGDYLSKSVAKTAPASHNYKVLLDCFVLSGLPRPKPPQVKEEEG